MLCTAGIDTGLLAYVGEAKEGGGKGKTKDSVGKLRSYGCRFVH